MKPRRRQRRPARKPPADKTPQLRHAEPERPQPGPGQTVIPLRPLQPTLWSL